MQVEQRTLKNDLNTVFVHRPGATSSSIQIWFRAGSSMEEKGDEGIAHFLEHMFFKGTPTRPHGQVAFDIESVGGETNAFTSFDYTCYYINMPAKHTNLGVDILLDMVTNPQFLQEELEPERGVVFEEFRRSQDNPGQFGFQKMQAQCFSKGYSHPILGHSENILQFSKEQLEKFRTNHYNKNNALLIVAGDLSQHKNQFIQTIENYQLPDGPESQYFPFDLKKRATVQVHKKDVRMSQLTLMIPSLPYDHPHAAAEELALSILAYGETSPLHKALVTQSHLCNAIGQSTMFFAQGGVHFIRTTCPPNHLKDAAKIFSKVIKNTIKKGLSEKQLQKLKNQYLSSKLYEKESLESFAFSLGHGFAQDKDIHSENEYLKKMGDLSLDKINESLKNIFQRVNHLSLQIPKNEKSKEAKNILLNLQKDISLLPTKGPKKAAKTTNHSKKTRSAFDSEVQVVEIKPGIELLYKQNTMTPTFILHAYLRGGLSEETEKNNGIHSLLSNSLTKGYQGCSNDKLKDRLDFLSASLSSFSGKNAYGMTLHGQSQHFLELAEHFSKSLLGPSFNSKFINLEKKLSLRRFENLKEDPTHQLFRLVDRNYFQGHSYRMHVLGNEMSLKSIKQQDIIRLHQRKLKTCPLLFTYCGDTPLQEVVETLRKNVTSLRPRKKPALHFKDATRPKEDHQSLYFDREQTQIFYSIPSQSLQDRDEVYLKILTAYLGGQSSELFTEVRDRLGLCYTAQPIHFCALEGGYWGIYMASGFDKVEAALKAIGQIVHKIRDNGLDSETFERIKIMISGQSQLNIQTNDDYANFYSIPYYQHLGLDYGHVKNKAVEELKVEDFNKNIKEILSRPWSTFLVGKETPQL